MLVYFWSSSLHQMYVGRLSCQLESNPKSESDSSFGAIAWGLVRLTISAEMLPPLPGGALWCVTIEDGEPTGGILWHWLASSVRFVDLCLFLTLCWYLGGGIRFCWSLELCIWIITITTRSRPRHPHPDIVNGVPWLQIGMVAGARIRWGCLLDQGRPVALMMVRVTEAVVLWRLWLGHVALGTWANSQKIAERLRRLLHPHVQRTNPQESQIFFCLQRDNCELLQWHLDQF